MPIDFKWVIGMSHPAAVDTRRRWPADSFSHDVRRGHIRRDRLLLRPKARQHRADAWMVIWPSTEIDERVTAVVTAQREIRCGTMRMADLMMGRPNNGRMMGLAGNAGQMLAHQDAGNGRGNRLELTANLHRGIRLHVPHVWLRRPTSQPDNDARLRASPLEHGRG